jgi:hypothetical protein
MKRHIACAAAGTLLAPALLPGSVSFGAADPAPAPGTLLLVAGTGLRGSLGDGAPPRSG